MVRVTFVEPSGSTVEIDIESGWKLMQAAVANGVEGIDAECGGSCVCATCHVYVDADRLSQMPPPGDDELELLEEVKAERKPNSRLSCQITVQENLSDLVVTIPERQT